MFNRFRIALYQLLIILLVVVVVAITVVLVRTQGKNSDKNYNYNYNAVVTNGHECSGIARKILENGGSAVDAAVSALICEGIACPESSGLGGGFLATIYIKSTGEIITLNAREVAPKFSTQDMFENNPEAAQVGGLSIAVPGEILGLWEMHKKYGVLEWAELIQPNIDLCVNGHKVTPYFREILEENEEVIMQEATLKDIFVNPVTGKIWVEGDVVKRPQLAETLRTIAKEGANSLYQKNGTLLQPLLDDIKLFRGNFTEDDFLDYKVKWEEPLSIDLNQELKLFSSPLPGSGPVLIFILNILKTFNLKDDSLPYHRVVEAFKYGYAKRTMLGDELSDNMLELVRNLTSFKYAEEIAKQINDEKTSNNFTDYGVELWVPEDHGTAHLCVLAANGDAVSITTTINYSFGSLRRSPKTGIILNNEMDDFSSPGFDNIYDFPPSPANFIKPGKYPLSSMAPSIALDKKGDVRLVIGGAGGTFITSGIAFVILEHVLKGSSLKEAIAHPRLHHQLLPMTLQYEKGFDKQIIADLVEKFNHTVRERNYDSGFSALTGISNYNGYIESVYDNRRVGSSGIF